MAEYVINDLRLGASTNPQPTGLIAYRSRGRVLIVGEAEAVNAVVEQLPDGLQPTAVVIGEGAAGNVRPLHRSARGNLKLDGHLGDFVLGIESTAGAGSAVSADLVVDLLDPPLLSRALLPEGYFPAAGLDLPALLAELPDLIGTFEKPQYTTYVADSCARGRRGQEGCRACLDACPAEAIIDLTERIEIDPYLCQGGGACATACPSGAIRYAYPPVIDSLATLREQLVASPAEARPVLLLHDREAGAVKVGQAELPAGWLNMAQEELASSGMDLWLSALAWGAGAVLLVRTGDEPAQSVTVLEQQMAIANAALEGLGYPPAVAWWDGSLDEDNAAMPVMTRAEHAPQGDKRRDFYSALDHLFRQAPAPAAESPMPAAAPFGQVTVDTDACTLCQSCVAVCPSGALTPGDGLPQIGFFEGACLQCGLCQGSCPENAISLQPRLLNDPSLRRQRRVLHEEAPFCCRSCGKPFATKSVIERMRDKLAGHPMFSAEGALARLEMCEDCRVVDMMQKGDL